LVFQLRGLDYVSSQVSGSHLANLLNGVMDVTEIIV
jgi:hypothetical protein